MSQETWSQIYELLERVNPKFHRNMHFAKKHRGPKMQANTVKAAGTHVEASKVLMKPEQVQPKLPKGPK